MSKSILVIDTPETCLDCMFCREIQEGTEACCELSKDIEDETLCRMITADYCQQNPDWCPLKELPDKKEEKQYLTRTNSRGSIETYGETKDAVAVGWNMCIDEILKGANENE